VVCALSPGKILLPPAQAMLDFLSAKGAQFPANPRRFGSPAVSPRQARIAFFSADRRFDRHRFKPLVDVGPACAAFREKTFAAWRRSRQGDEIWSFSYAKYKNVKFDKAAPEGLATCGLGPPLMPTPN
jgi:hypothetical protein